MFQRKTSYINDTLELKQFMNTSCLCYCKRLIIHRHLNAFVFAKTWFLCCQPPPDELVARESRHRSQKATLLILSAHIMGNLAPLLVSWICFQRTVQCLVLVF